MFCPFSEDVLKNLTLKLAEFSEPKVYMHFGKQVSTSVLHVTCMHTHTHTHIHTYILYVRTCMYIHMYMQHTVLTFLPSASCPYPCTRDPVQPPGGSLLRTNVLPTPGTGHGQGLTQLSVRHPCHRAPTGDCHHVLTSLLRLWLDGTVAETGQKVVTSSPDFPSLGARWTNSRPDQ